MQPKKRKLSNHQQIIARFVNVKFLAGNRGFWPNEMRIAGQLIKKYGFEFLIWLPPPNEYRINSLVWFLSSVGKNYLAQQLVVFGGQSPDLFPEKEEISLSPDKIGEDININLKPKTLKDFLYGKKN